MLHSVAELEKAQTVYEPILDSNIATAPAPYRLRRTFRAVSEVRPGKQWQRLLADGWIGWREWYVARAASTASTEREAVRAVRRYMPELEKLLDGLAGHLPDDPVLREFLAFWCPPRYLVNCTQAASVDDQGPFLMRNYDLDPALNEATLLHSQWRGKKVMGMVEGLSGLSDGINENGLAISLSFGGRVIKGRGFGIPLIMRYVLETCTDVQDGIEALRAIPCHMSYNVTMVDVKGAMSTAFLAPDRRAMIQNTPWATNHQLGVEWPRHGRMSATIERAQRLHQRYKTTYPTEAQLRRAFLGAPFFSRNYRAGYGTVFSACYRPIQQTALLGWGDKQVHCWSMNSFKDTSLEIEYTDAGSRVLTD
ncbi:MAG: hypothetical protein COA78_00100 [Blastopirellula sp.]|nr:MAG: hypothetical protein COA78_00100 [Blastopirellula sp.]